MNLFTNRLFTKNDFILKKKKKKENKYLLYLLYLMISFTQALYGMNDIFYTTNE